MRRRNFLLGALLAAALLAGIVALAESLRHPLPDRPGQPEATGLPAADEDPHDDPRVEFECPEPLAADPDGTEDTAVGQDSPVEVSSSDLHACPDSYERALVAYEGEAVGAVMHRDAGAWVQLNDDAYADAGGRLPAHRDYRGGNDGVGVLLPHALADEVATVGGPGRQGDLLAITGTFHRVHPVHGDVVVIEAHAGEVVRPGMSLEDAPLRDRQTAAVVLAVAALGLVGVERFGAVRWRHGLRR